MIWFILYIFLGFITIAIVHRFGDLYMDDMEDGLLGAATLLIWPFVAMAGCIVLFCKGFDWFCDLITKKSKKDGMQDL